MIEYVEIYAFDGSRLALEGVVDGFSSVIWKNSYYGVGEFEIYAPASQQNLDLLKGGRYVITPDGGDREVGIIERVEVTFSPSDGRMVAATGRFAKSILDRRIIYSPVYDAGEGGSGYVWHSSAKILTGRVDAAAALLVKENAAQPENPYPQYLKGDRSLPVLAWNEDDGRTKFPETISVDTGEEEEDAEKQVTYKGLLDYTDSLLEEYGLGGRLWLDRDLMLLRYEVFKGELRARNDHFGNEPVVFSQEMDNLVSTGYVYDESAKKTTAFVGGEGEGTDRKCAFAYEWLSGMDRRETFVDASSITTEAEEGEPAVDLQTYRKQLEAQGQQTIAQAPAEETLSGEMDITNSPLQYRRDFYVGDVVTLEDSALGIATDVRILSVTEVQDENGYNIDIEYGEK